METTAKQKQSWIPVGTYKESLAPAIQSLHHAAQFITMVSNSYLPHEADDSQNTMGWNTPLKRLEGRWVKNPRVRISLDIPAFELIIEAQNQTHILGLDAQTKEQIISNLRIRLRACGLDETLLKPVSQFTIPQHPVDEGMPFEKPQEKALLEWTNWRTNAHAILETIQGSLDWPADVRIWPHHFDTGLLISVTRDEVGHDIQTIGLGLAIGDANVNEPYFYINHWSSEGVAYPPGDPAIRRGYWFSGDWKGFILPARAILSQPLQQEQFVKEFFQDGVNATLFLMGKLPQSLFNDD